MLVLLHVEGLERVPSMLESLLQALEAVKNRQLIIAFALAGVSILQQLALVRLEQTERVVCVEFEDDYHESAHQEAGVRHLLGTLAAGVVVNLGWS
jgi:hypothetical protein